MKNYTKYNINIEIEITPQNLAKIFWEMDDDQQADFFNNLSVIASLEEIEDQLFYTRKNEMMTESGREVMNLFGEH